MTTLEEIEKLENHAASTEERDIRDILECRRIEAIATLTGAATEATKTAASLARAVLAMLPVVRLAEKYADADLVAPDMRDAIASLRSSMARESEGE